MIPHLQKLASENTDKLKNFADHDFYSSFQLSILVFLIFYLIVALPRFLVHMQKEESKVNITGTA